MNYYRQKNNVELTKLDEEWIILDLDQLTVTKLNQLGGTCWRLLKTPQSAETLTKSVQDCDEEDIAAFLNQLFTYGLIEHAVS
ncbi:PqqD family protein [Bacillaceae bacterium Marseille-Q3522]|nr:PqqD family protein [Bacillaceae bacterium Marseille-Q3522]